MKKIILLVMLLIFSSCEIQYDGETKLVLKGKVLDENNVPFANKEIKLFVTRDGASIPFIFYILSETNFVGKAITDSNGKYTMVIPQPKNFSQIIVEANSTNNDFNEKQFINIKQDDFINYELNLPTTMLYKKSDLTLLNIIPNQLNTNNELLKLEYIGEIPFEIQTINNQYTIYNPYQTSINVKKNQTVILSYTVKDYSTNITSTLQQNITIDNSSQIDYILNY